MWGYFAKRRRCPCPTLARHTIGPGAAGQYSATRQPRYMDKSSVEMQRRWTYGSTCTDQLQTVVLGSTSKAASARDINVSHTLSVYRNALE